MTLTVDGIDVLHNKVTLQHNKIKGGYVKSLGDGSFEWFIDNRYIGMYFWVHQEHTMINELKITKSEMLRLKSKIKQCL